MACQNHIGYEVRILNNMLYRHMDSILKRCNLTVMQFGVISYIYKNAQQDVFQRDLEHEFSINRSTATNILQLMVRRDLLTRESVDYDDRLKKLCLTQQSIDKHRQIVADLAGTEARLQQGITPEDLEAFHRVVHKLEVNLEQTAPDGAAPEGRTQFI